MDIKIGVESLVLINAWSHTKFQNMDNIGKLFYCLAKFGTQHSFYMFVAVTSLKVKTP